MVGPLRGDLAENFEAVLEKHPHASQFCVWVLDPNRKEAEFSKERASLGEKYWQILHHSIERIVQQVYGAQNIGKVLKAIDKIRQNVLGQVVVAEEWMRDFISFFEEWSHSLLFEEVVSCIEGQKKSDWLQLLSAVAKAQMDPEWAVSEAGSFDNPILRSMAIAKIAAHVLREDAELAEQYADKIELEEARDWFLAVRLGYQADKDLAGALKEAREITHPVVRQKALCKVALSAAKTDPARAYQIADELLDVEVKRRLLGKIVKREAKKSQEAAHATLKAWMQKDEVATSFVMMAEIAGVLARKSLPLALKFADTIEIPELYEKAFLNIAVESEKQSQGLGYAVLRDADLELSERDRLALICAGAKRSPAKSLKLARELKDPFLKGYALLFLAVLIHKKE